MAFFPSTHNRMLTPIPRKGERQLSAVAVDERYHLMDALATSVAVRRTMEGLAEAEEWFGSEQSSDDDTLVLFAEPEPHAVRRRAQRRRACVKNAGHTKARMAALAAAREKRTPWTLVKRKGVVVPIRERRHLQLVREHEAEIRSALLGDPVCWKAELIETIADPGDKYLVRELLDDELRLFDYTGVIRVAGHDFVFENGKRIAPIEFETASAEVDDGVVAEVVVEDTHAKVLLPKEEADGADVFFFSTTIDPDDDVDPEVAAILAAEQEADGHTDHLPESTFVDYGGGVLSRPYERQRLAEVMADIEPDMDDPERAYKGCEPPYLPAQ